MIEFRNVSMSYKTGIQALKNVSFKVQDGEFVFIIGLSGSGKSTLVKLLTCEENPSKGNVFIDDYDISFLKRSLIPYLRRNIGMVFQDFRLIYSKTVYENVAFAMEIIGASQKLIKHRVPIVLSIVGLRDKAFVKANELSGGEQQRVVIARAMVNNPMLILADEPTGNLDPVNSELIMALLEEINYNGTTVIVCTHESSIVNRMRRRVIEISDGSLVRDEMLGEYNLATSSENQKRKNKSAKPHARKPEASANRKLPVHGIPFIRNINIKFGEVENAENSENDSETSEEDIDAIDVDIIGRDDIDIDVTGIDAIDNTEDDINSLILPKEPKGRGTSSPGEKKTLLSASEYYQKWVREHHKPDSDKNSGTYKNFIKERHFPSHKEAEDGSLLQEIKEEIASKDYIIEKEEKISAKTSSKPHVSDSEENEDETIDFQSLIKPKRVEKSPSTEDLQ